MADKTTTRTRNFVSIGYPESLIEGWLEVLEETHIPCIISPLHDKDVNPTGEVKKPHYHIMIMYEGPHTMEQAQKIFDLIGAVQCKTVNSVRGQARYFLHMDNPEKAEYSIENVKALNGADYQELIQLPSDKYGIIKEMLRFIEKNDILSFSQLLLWCSSNKEDWFRALCDSSAYIIKEYLASREYTLKNLDSYRDMNKSNSWSLPSGKEGEEE
jgi:hypothetical protein